jgi:HEPN domain-containing protein
MKPELVELVHHWTRRADHHLVSGAALIDCGRDGVWDAACYHAHEAIAIYLKALHTLHGIPAPRTHDLEYLNRILPESGRLQLNTDKLACLSTYGIERWWEPDETMAQEALEFAGRARDELCRVVREAGVVPRKL